MEEKDSNRRALADIGNIEGPSRACGDTVPQPQLSDQVDAEAAENHEEDAPAGALEESPIGDEANNSAAQVEDFSGSEAEEESISASSEESGVFYEAEMEEEEEEEEEPGIDEADEDYMTPAVEYVEDISDFYRITEAEACVPPGYLSRQPEITERSRASLIDWIAETHCLLGLLHETLFLAVNLTDRYLSRRVVRRSELKVVGATALLLAYEHEEDGVPNLKELLALLEIESRKFEVLEMEKRMLQVLDFIVTVPTISVFMTRFLRATKSTKHLETVCYFLAELCLLEYDMLKYSPSMLAAAAIYTGRCVLGLSPPWSYTMQCLTAYSENELRECVKMVVLLHQNAEENEHATSVRMKYSSRVGEHEPASWLL